MSARARIPWHLVVLTAVIAAAGGYLAYGYVAAERGEAPAENAAADLDGQPLVGQRRPDYTLGSVDGSIISAADFDGQVVLVNFWATWCAPCREEMPMLMELREELRGDGFEVVGVALDDVQRARDFVEELDIQYPILVGSTDVMVTMQVYGNASGVMPYSVLVDRDGIIRWTRLGVLERDALVSEIHRWIGDI